MKIKSALAIPLIALATFAVPAHAEDNNKPPQTGNELQQHNGQDGIPNPENHEGGEGREFKHQITESEESGFEIVQFLVVGGAIVVAALLAYSAGKRSKKKKEDQGK